MSEAEILNLNEGQQRMVDATNELLALPVVQQHLTASAVIAEASVVTNAEPTTEANLSTDTKRRPRREEKPGEKRTPRPKRVPAPANEMADLKQWLIDLKLGVTPTVHVNGSVYASCVLAVDFGTPLKGIKLTPEQSSELVSRLRGVTKTVMAKEVKVGVLNDHSAGIWWTTIS